MSKVQPVAIKVPEVLGGGLMDVVGEIVTPALAVTPSIDEDASFLGLFTVTHSVSGNAIVGGDGCISCARKAAKMAAASGVDWTRDGATVAADKAAAGIARAVREILLDCSMGRRCGR